VATGTWRACTLHGMHCEGGSRRPHPRLGWAALAGALAALAVAAGAAGAQQAAPVATATARETELVEELGLTGSLTSPRTARLSPEVEGRVARVAVEEGDRVEAGDPVVELDAELAELALERAQAAEREARTELADAERRLGEIQALARRQTAAESRVRDLEAEVRRDRAVLQRLAAERATQAGLLRRHVVKAPFAGVVARRLTELGEWVEPGTLLVELVATEWLRLDLQVPQTWFGRVVPGTPARIQLDARSDGTFEARVHQVVPVGDASARTFLTRVRLENPDARMAPGMSARATLRVATGRRGVVVPRDALIRHPDGRIVVWVAEGEGATRVVRERRVRLGPMFGDRVAVAEGLEAGAEVVVRGNEALQEGQEVRVRSRSPVESGTAALDS